MPNERVALGAIRDVMGVPQAIFDPSNIADDVKSLTEVWPDESEFVTAINSSIKAMNLVVSGKAHTTSLKRDLRGWDCFHYLHTRRLRDRADMRLVFRRVGDGIEVLGFGHRYLPVDFYDRVAANRARKRMR